MNEIQYYNAFRTGLERFMKQRKLSARSWCERAGLAEGTLRKFFEREGAMLTMRSITKLAKAENMTAQELLIAVQENIPQGTLSEAPTPLIKEPITNTTSSQERFRSGLKTFMETQNLKVRPWTAAANVSEATLRNYLNGNSESLTSRILEKLAFAVNMTLAQLIVEIDKANKDNSSKTLVKEPTSDSRIIKRIGDINDAERTWWMGHLSPDTTCRINISGKMGKDELDNLITQLNYQREMLN